MIESKTKESILSLLDELLAGKVMDSISLQRYILNNVDEFEPEGVRLSLYKWYYDLGIEDVIKRKFELSPCPFSSEELREAEKCNEIVLCVPKGITRVELGKLFRIDNWAFNDPIATRVTEKEDCWFRTNRNTAPGFLGEKGIDIEQRFSREGKLSFSMERYLVFLARMKYLLGIVPDSEYWIWLPAGRYDRSGMLIAGFDRNMNFNVHGWMPQFSASFLGARYGILPKNA